MTTSHSDLGLTSATEKSSGGCCGGSCGCGSATPSAEQPITIGNEQDFGVNGMTCNNCVNHVTKAISELDGVTSVRVDLNAGGTSTVHVASSTPINANAVRDAVEAAGYHLA